MRDYKFFTDCTQCNDVDELHNMTEQAKEITYRTLIKHVNYKHITKVLPVYETHYKKGLMIKDDYSVSFYKSQWKGETVYYIVNSGIEFIFKKNYKQDKLSYMQMKCPPYRKFSTGFTTVKNFLTGKNNL